MLVLRVGGSLFNFYIGLEIDMPFYPFSKGNYESINGDDEARARRAADAWVEDKGNPWKIKSFGSYFTGKDIKRAREDAVNRAKGREIYEKSKTPGRDRHAAASYLRRLEDDLKSVKELLKKDAQSDEYISLEREIEYIFMGYDEAKAANTTKEGGRRRTRRRTRRRCRRN